MSDCWKCKWAEWHKTPTGRNRHNDFGRCTYPIPDMPKLPRCVAEPQFHRIVIWAGETHDCPTFEPKTNP